MGLVYRARQRRPDRLVAIKVVTPELAADPTFKARFEQESATAAEIEHPNVIPVYEVGEDHGLLFIVMRFVAGEDLGNLMRQEGRLAPARAVAAGVEGRQHGDEGAVATGAAALRAAPTQLERAPQRPPGAPPQRRWLRPALVGLAALLAAGGLAVGLAVGLGGGGGSSSTRTQASTGP